jgi:hypothetical protein
MPDYLPSGWEGGVRSNGYSYFTFCIPYFACCMGGKGAELSEFPNT